MAANPYRPWPARITSITELTATEKLFEFRLIDERIREAFRHEPGQFVELTIFGVGEAPISISSCALQARLHRAVRAPRRSLHRGAAQDAVRRHRGYPRAFRPRLPVRGDEGPRYPVGGRRSGHRAAAHRSSTTSTTSAASSARSPSSTVRRTPPRSCSATSSRCGATARISTCT